ncbi:MAG: hypothetical protein J7598_16635 [Mitsuaria chitosanitabida]|uniref:hypothetical protein n=1 Tax=Roseateles chitosanitabidus TaxID=65048 RepID=UPI001B04FFE0|nr:hypothetical protein [Roseateles chitosanitabidus]MBO9688230.1 hypothetical protein [Roseateles chitosanitabidus]
MTAIAFDIFSLRAPGLGLLAAGFVLGIGIASFGDGGGDVDRVIDEDLLAVHRLERLDSLMDEAGEQLMRARVAPRLEAEAGPRGAFHRVTALGYQAEQTRADMLVGARGTPDFEAVATMVSADRRAWALVAEENELLRDGAPLLASRLHESGADQALDGALVARRGLRARALMNMADAARGASLRAAIAAVGGVVAAGLLLVGVMRMAGGRGRG